MLVLSLVVMALTQLLWTAMRRGQQGIAFAGTVGVAGSIAALYFFLAQMAYYFFSSSGAALRLGMVAGTVHCGGPIIIFDHIDSFSGR